MLAVDSAPRDCLHSLTCGCTPQSSKLALERRIPLVLLISLTSPFWPRNPDVKPPVMIRLRPIQIISLSHIQLVWELRYIHRSPFYTRIICHHIHRFCPLKGRTLLQGYYIRSRATGSHLKILLTIIFLL